MCTILTDCTPTVVSQSHDSIVLAGTCFRHHNKCRNRLSTAQILIGLEWGRIKLLPGLHCADTLWQMTLIITIKIIVLTIIKSHLQSAAKSVDTVNNWHWPYDSRSSNVSLRQWILTNNIHLTLQTAKQLEMNQSIRCNLFSDLV